MSALNTIFQINHLAIALAGFFIVLSLSSCFDNSSDPEKQIVLKVNDESLSLKMFSESLANRLRGLDALTVKDKSAINRIKRGILRDFITDSLAKKWAKSHNLFVRKEQLDTKILSIRNIYPDDLAFRRALADQGLSFTAWSEKIRISLLQKLIVRSLATKKTDVTPKELSSYFKNHEDRYKQSAKVRISQIVLSTEANAKHVALELRKGKKFNRLAKSFSITPEASNSGDIGWVEKGTLAVFDRVFKMRIGKVSEIIKSPYGYHILKVTGKRRARKSSFKDAKKYILEILLEKREQALYASWLEQQIRTSRVFKDDGLIANISIVTRSAH